MVLHDARTYYMHITCNNVLWTVQYTLLCLCIKNHQKRAGAFDGVTLVIPMVLLWLPVHARVFVSLKQYHIYRDPFTSWPVPSGLKTNCSPSLFEKFDRHFGFSDHVKISREAPLAFFISVNVGKNHSLGFTKSSESARGGAFGTFQLVFRQILYMLQKAEWQKTKCRNELKTKWAPRSFFKVALYEFSVNFKVKKYFFVRSQMKVTAA